MPRWISYIYKYICKEKNYFVFIIYQVNNQGVFRRWFTETDVKHFKSGALQAITNITSWHSKLKKSRPPSQVYFQNLVIDTEKLYEKQISLRVFFKNSADRFGIPYLKNGFL